MPDVILRSPGKEEVRLWSDDAPVVGDWVDCDGIEGRVARRTFELRKKDASDAYFCVLDIEA